MHRLKSRQDKRVGTWKRGISKPKTFTTSITTTPVVMFNIGLTNSQKGAPYYFTDICASSFKLWNKNE